jgi:hypothetical protein
VIDFDVGQASRWTYSSTNVLKGQASVDISLVLSGASLAVSVPALLISLSNARSARRSATADEAQQSMEEARRSEELQANHDRLGPGYPGPIRGYLKTGLLGESLFGDLTVPRAYRAQIEGWMGNSYAPLAGLPLLLHPGVQYTVHVEHWPTGRTRPQTDEIRLKLWPPVSDIDEADPWECPCGRAPGADIAGPAHWEVRIPVVYEPTPEPFAVYGP